MKIVCICEDDTIGNFIRDGLRPDHELPLVIMPEFNASKPRKRHSGTPAKLLAKLISKVFFSFASRRPSKKILAQKVENSNKLIADNSKSVSPVESRIPVNKINSRSTAELIAKHEPDLMFVCGAPILEKRIFSIPKYGSVNFHFGYSPKYRGHHGLLWPYLKGDYQHIAGTFLKIDDGVDTGTPLAFVYPEVLGSDTIENIEAKVAKMARGCISPVMNSVAQGCGELQFETPEKQFQISYADYGPLVHVKYVLKQLENCLVARKSVLRSQYSTINQFQFENKTAQELQNSA